MTKGFCLFSPDRSLTDGELFKAKAVTDDQVAVAVDAYPADDSTGAFEIAPGCPVHLTEEIEQHSPARMALADSGAGKAFRRTMVRTAILLARAEPDSTAK